MVEKVGFTNCVFEKLCFPENTIFIVFSAKHSFFKKQKLYVEKNRKFMKNSGLFLNMAKWCFLGGLFFGVLILKVCFWCVWYCFKSVKNVCFFPNFLVFFFFFFFSGVAHCCSSGFGRFRCFCVFCVCFFFVLLLFLFCLLCSWFCGLMLLFCFFWCVFFGCFLLFCFFLFVFFGGFKGHVRWPKGPPHLALNPPYFICFWFFVFLCLVLFFVYFLFFLFVFLEGLRVR